jgi:uncharacterized protein
MTPKIALLDVNVLIAICDGHHIHHLHAAQWFSQHAKYGWASCPLTQNGVIRILPQLTKRPVGQVIEQIHAMCASKHHHFWSDSLSIVDANKIDHDHLLGHNQITDIYLLALAVQNKGQLITLDKSIPIQAVKDAVKQNLIQLLGQSKSK